MHKDKNIFPSTDVLRGCGIPSTDIRVNNGYVARLRHVCVARFCHR